MTPLAYARQVLLDAANEIEKQLPEIKWPMFKLESIERMEACRKVAASIDVAERIEHAQEA
jgi:hypothetical protein